MNTRLGMECSNPVFNCHTCYKNARENQSTLDGVHEHEVGFGALQSSAQLSYLLQECQKESKHPWWRTWTWGWVWSAPIQCLTIIPAKRMPDRIKAPSVAYMNTRLGMECSNPVINYHTCYKNARQNQSTLSCVHEHEVGYGVLQSSDQLSHLLQECQTKSKHLQWRTWTRGWVWSAQIAWSCITPATRMPNSQSTLSVVHEHEVGYGVLQSSVQLSYLLQECQTESKHTWWRTWTRGWVWCAPIQCSTIMPAKRMPDRIKAPLVAYMNTRLLRSAPIQCSTVIPATRIPERIKAPLMAYMNTRLGLVCSNPVFNYHTC